MYISTRQAVIYIQKLLNQDHNAGLAVDGIYGPATFSALQEALGEEPEEPEQPDPEPTEKPHSDNFSFEEYYSNAIIDGVKVLKVVEPPKELWPPIQRSMDALEALRGELGGHPITITSGYRTPEYNAYIDGAKKSQHMYGTATDIKVKNISPSQVYEVANRLYKDGGVSKYDSFTHVDVRGHHSRW